MDPLGLSDLIAQQRMAEAAEAMLLLTKVQIGVAIAGTLGLLVTIAQSARAHKLSSKAILDAQKRAQDDLAISQAQARAYIRVRIDEILLSTEGIPNRVTVVSENAGLTPAKRVRVAMGVRFAPTDAVGEPRYTNPSSAIDIPAGKDQETTTELAQVAGIGRAYLEGVCRMFVFVRADYVDIFGRDQYVTATYHIGHGEEHAGDLPDAHEAS